VKVLISLALAPILLLSFDATAQSGAQNSQSFDELEVINIENLYKNNPPPTQPTAPTQPSVPPPTAEESQQVEEIKRSGDFKNMQMRSVTDLNQLSPFSDVSVIQKKYLPKTGRFQLFTAAGLTTNSPWFLNLGARVNLGYNFTESFGLEATGLFLTNSALDAAKDIKNNNNLQPDKFVVTKGYLGLDLVWSPIYGKITDHDNKIIPFDTTAQEKNVTTFHLGTGQIFALSKSMAFRWDYSWHFFQATPVQDAASTNAPSKGSYNDLILTAGVSFFFPEASYR
jgi:outer membrane beta-barrel protein